MAQFMGYGKSRAQSIIFANRTASGGVTKGSQFSQTYGKERTRVYLNRQLWLGSENMQERVGAQRTAQPTHLGCHTCPELCRCPV